MAVAAWPLAGCRQEAGAAGEKRVFKVGHAASESNTGHRGLLEFDRLLRERSGGRLSLEIHANSRLGSERELIEALQLGRIDMAFVSSAPLAGFKKEFFALDLPFVFQDRAAIYRLLDGPVGQTLLAHLAEINIKGLGFWENGFRQLSTAQRPVRTPDDLKGLRVRTMENEVHVQTWRELGAQAAPLAFNELFTALQQGVFDAQETPVNLFHDMNFFEVQRYITRTSHLYSPFVVMMSKWVYDRLPEADRQLIAEVFPATQAYQRTIAQQSDAEAEAAMPQIGFIELSEAERAAFRERMGPVHELARQKAGAGIVDQILQAMR